jgi:DNA-binding MarR family transcriptional regulator
MAGDKIDRAFHHSDLPHDGTTPREVMSRVFLLASNLDRRLSKLFDEFGLTRGEADVLDVLRQAENAPITPKMLSKSLVCSAGTTTNRLDRLEAAGLVVRLDDPTDRRGFRLTLTKAGRTLIGRVATERQHMDSALLATLTREQRKSLVTLLRAALLEFEEPNANAAAPPAQKVRRTVQTLAR